jgi:Type II secretion system (T2SS), protein E, N-terminal domain
MNLRDLPLGSLIVRDGLASVATVRNALFEAKETDRRLGEVMLAQGWIGERDLARLLAEQAKLGFVDLAKVHPNEAAVDELPQSVAQRVQAIAYAFDNEELLVAVADPTDEYGLSEVRGAVDRRVRFTVAVPSEIEALSGAFGKRLLQSA